MDFDFEHGLYFGVKGVATHHGWGFAGSFLLIRYPHSCRFTNKGVERHRLFRVFNFCRTQRLSFSIYISNYPLLHASMIDPAIEFLSFSSLTKALRGNTLL